MKHRPWLVLALGMAPVLCSASVHIEPFWGRAVHESLITHERQLWIAAIHESEFASVPRAATRISCQATRQPEALATPDPLLATADATAKITVSFIIGTDGRVHSPLILESVGSWEDRTVLDAVRSWRYRPAMCNGVPAEAEARIEFSSQ